MPVEIDLGVSSPVLYADLLRHFTLSGSCRRLNDRAFQAGGLRFTRLGEDDALDSLEPEPDPDSFVYLDDRYERVKAGAQMGWRTVWLNREGEILSDELPVQDGECHSFSDLPKLTSLQHKPTLRQCRAWWDEWELPENIRRHSQTVAWGAYALAVMMLRRGSDLDPILVHRGGLLHDIDKIATLKGQAVHGGPGADFLLKKGYPKMADIVRGHIMGRILAPDADARPWEGKLVFFVDKLVEGEEIVPFNQRLAALKKRYPAFRTTMEKAEAGVWALSDQICSILSIPNHEKLISTLIKLKDN